MGLSGLMHSLFKKDLVVIINKKCDLFLRDLYSYDISACHYTILRKFGFDLSQIEKEDKEKRNIQIGKLMAENPRMTSLLRTSTESTINEYLARNNVSEEELIVRQYDGIITTKRLKNTNDTLPLELKELLNVLILSSDRSKFIATEGRRPIIKGMSNRYQMIDNIIFRLLKINFSSKEMVFKSLESIKQEILKSEDPTLYCIPSGEDKFTIMLKGYGQTVITKTLTRILDTSDIDREWYFNHYIRPFTESITIEFLRRSS